MHCHELSKSYCSIFLLQLLHYRVTVMAVKSPRRQKPGRQSLPASMDFHLGKATSGSIVNVKSVPANMIITRTYKEALGEASSTAANIPDTPDSEEGSCGAGLEMERKWGTPQLHFNRKYLKNTLSSDGNSVDIKEDELRPLHAAASVSVAAHHEDKLSLCSNSTSYTKRVSDSLRRSFRTLKSDLSELRPFSRKKTPVYTTATVAKSAKQ